jgi:hypothetical protein
VPNKLNKTKNKKNEFLNNGTTSHHAPPFWWVEWGGPTTFGEFKTSIRLAKC